MAYEVPPHDAFVEIAVHGFACGGCFVAHKFESIDIYLLHKVLLALGILEF